MTTEGVMVGGKFLPADIIEHVLNLRRCSIQKETWKGQDGYFWSYMCVPKREYISIMCHKDRFEQEVLFEFGTSAAWSIVLDEYLKLMD